MNAKRQAQRNRPVRARWLHWPFAKVLFSENALLRSFQPHALAIEETPPSPFTAILLWSIVFLFLAALIWAWISRIPIMTTAPGKFTTDARTKIVQSLNAGTVRKILVKTGDAVSKGQALVELDSEADRAKLASSTQDRAFNRMEVRRDLSELGSSVRSGGVPGATPEMALLEGQLATAQLKQQRSKLNVDRAQIRQDQANLAAGLATLTEYVQRAQQDEGLAQAAQPLVAEGALAGQQYIQLKDQVIVDRGQLLAQRQQIRQLQAALTGAQQQLDEDIHAFASAREQELESTTAKSFDLNSQYTQASRDVVLDQLRSPVDGIVQSMGVASIGSAIQAGQTAVTIEPSDAPLIVEADLPAQDAGFVKVGQSTRIKVTAYPFEQYGSIPGKVVWISPTAESISTLSSLPPGDSHQPLTPPSQNPSLSGTEQTQSSGPPVLYYRVKITPARNWLDVEGQHQRMRAGMTASIDIETGQRRVLDFFLDPIIKYAENGITVR